MLQWCVLSSSASTFLFRSNFVFCIWFDFSCSRSPSLALSLELRQVDSNVLCSSLIIHFIFDRWIALNIWYSLLTIFSSSLLFSVLYFSVHIFFVPLLESISVNERERERVFVRVFMSLCAEEKSTGREGEEGSADGRKKEKVSGMTEKARARRRGIERAWASEPEREASRERESREAREGEEKKILNQTVNFDVGRISNRDRFW